MRYERPTACTSFYGHKYEARYSYGQPSLLEASNSWADDIVPILEASKSKTYERDICVRCGHVIERKP